jgi:hypothetical protein
MLGVEVEELRYQKGEVKKGMRRAEGVGEEVERMEKKGEGGVEEVEFEGLLL